MSARRTWVVASAAIAVTIIGYLDARTPATAADAALIAAAQREGSVTWYTTQTINQLVRPLAEAFEKAYGVKLDYIRANSTEVALRVQNEAAAGRLQADVVDGTSTAPLLKRQSLVAKYIPALAESLPPEVRDADGYWVATNYFVITPGVNTDLVPAGQEPKSWDDLLAPKWKGRIAWSGNNSSSAGPGFVGLVLKEWGEAKGLDYLRKLSNQQIAASRVAARQILDQVIAGEYAIGLQTFNHHAVISAAKGAPVRWLPLSPVMVNLSTASVLAQAPHPNAARLLLEFLISEEGQAIFRKENYLPVNPRVLPEDPSLIPDGKRLRGTFFTPEEIETNMPAWDRTFKEIFR
jgi:ABC-type Fe3+ transport system substrate-binding protein